MKKILVVVDMQNDFIDGSLGTAEAVKIVPNVVNLIREFDGMVIATRDTHYDNYMDSQEGKHLPVIHCLKDSHGWEISDAVKKELGDATIFDKPTFGSAELVQKIVQIEKEEGVESVTFVGLCTGICVLSNAITLKAFLPETPLYVVEDCCACVTPDSHKTALDAMRLCQINII